MLAYDTLACTIHGKYIEKLYKSNRFKILALKWCEGSELPYGPYSVSDIQDYLEYTLKKLKEKTGNPLIKIY